ncbi:MAG: hypothetical protein HQM12_18340 [SAR324 cluster bacterium]|nr:hypothetical protein [SAR324 cluster bacterium]
MNRFSTLCDSYNSYLTDAANYHEDCARMLDKLRYMFLAYLECDQDALIFRSAKPAEQGAKNEPPPPPVVGPQAKPLMSFGDGGFWNVLLVIFLPQSTDPQKKGTVWFRLNIKKSKLDQDFFTIKIIAPPLDSTPLERKISQDSFDKTGKELCDWMYHEAVHLYQNSFQTLLAEGTQRIGFQMQEIEEAVPQNLEHLIS